MKIFQGVATGNSAGMALKFLMYSLSHKFRRLQLKISIRSNLLKNFLTWMCITHYVYLVFSINPTLTS